MSQAKLQDDNGVANPSAEEIELEEGMRFRDTDAGPAFTSEFEIQETDMSEWKVVYCDGYVAAVDSRWIEEGLENGKLKRVGGSR